MTSGAADIQRRSSKSLYRRSRYERQLDGVRQLRAPLAGAESGSHPDRWSDLLRGLLRPEAGGRTAGLVRHRVLRQIHGNTRRSEGLGRIYGDHRQRSGRWTYSQRNHRRLREYVP